MYSSNSDDDDDIAYFPTEFFDIFDDRDPSVTDDLEKGEGVYLSDSFRDPKLKTREQTQEDYTLAFTSNPNGIFGASVTLKRIKPYPEDGTDDSTNLEPTNNTEQRHEENKNDPHGNDNKSTSENVDDHISLSSRNMFGDSGQICQPTLCENIGNGSKVNTIETEPKPAGALSFKLFDYSNERIYRNPSNEDADDEIDVFKWLYEHEPGASKPESNKGVNEFKPGEEPYHSTGTTPNENTSISVGNNPDTSSTTEASMSLNINPNTSTNTETITMSGTENNCDRSVFVESNNITCTIGEGNESKSVLNIIGNESDSIANAKDVTRDPTTSDLNTCSTADSVSSAFNPTSTAVVVPASTSDIKTTEISFATTSYASPRSVETESASSSTNSPELNSAEVKTTTNTNSTGTIPKTGLTFGISNPGTFKDMISSAPTTNSIGSTLPTPTGLAFLTPRSPKSIDSDSLSTESSSSGSISGGTISEQSSENHESNSSGYGSPNLPFTATCDIIHKPKFAFETPKFEPLNKTVNSSNVHSLFGKPVYWNIKSATPNNGPNSGQSSTNAFNLNKADATTSRSDEYINDTTISTGAIPKTSFSFGIPKSEASKNTSTTDFSFGISSSGTSSAIGSKPTSTLATAFAHSEVFKITNMSSTPTNLSFRTPSTVSSINTEPQTASSTTNSTESKIDVSTSKPKASISDMMTNSTGAKPKQEVTSGTVTFGDANLTESLTKVSDCGMSDATNLTGVKPKITFSFGVPNVEVTTSPSTASSTKSTATSSSETTSGAITKTTFSFGIPNIGSAESTSSKSSTNETNSNATNSSDTMAGAKPKISFSFGIPNTGSAESTSSKSSTNQTNSSATNDNTSGAIPKTPFSFGIPNAGSSKSTSSKASTNDTSSSATNSSDTKSGAKPKTSFSFGIPNSGSSKSSSTKPSAANPPGTKASFPFNVPKTTSLGVPNLVSNNTNTSSAPITFSFGTPICDFASSSTSMVQSFKKVLCKPTTFNNSPGPEFAFGSTPGVIGPGFFANQTRTAIDWSGTGVVRYKPVREVDSVKQGDSYKNIDVNVCAISVMREYEKKSIEELRYEDYMAGRKGRSHQSCAFCTPDAICVFDKNFATSKPPSFSVKRIASRVSNGLTGTHNSNGRGTGVIRYRPTIDGEQCNICVISVMKEPLTWLEDCCTVTNSQNLTCHRPTKAPKWNATFWSPIQGLTASEYETKSLDELRYEDYMARRQGRTMHKCSFCPSDYFCTFDEKYNTKPFDNRSPNACAFGPPSGSKSGFPTNNNIFGVTGTKISAFDTPASNIPFGTTDSNSPFGPFTSNTPFGIPTNNIPFGTRSNNAFGTSSNGPFGTPDRNSPFGTLNGPFGGTSSNTPSSNNNNVPIVNKNLFSTTTTPNISGFGSPSTNSSTFGTPSTAFNAPSTSKSTFGTPSTATNAPSTNKSTFETPSTATNAPSTSKSTFGTPSTATNAPSTNKSTFETPSTATNAPSTNKSTFETPSTATNAPSTSKSTFGTPSTATNAPSTNKSTFETPSTATNAPSTNKSTFETPSTATNAPSTSKSTFGTPSTAFNAPTTSKSTFGTPSTAVNAPSTSKSTFGTPSTAFNAPTTSKSTFGTPSTAFNAPTTSKSTFGTPSTAFNAPTTSKSTFGTPSTAFNAPTTSKSTFGTPSTAFNAPTTSKSIFGPPYTTSNVPSTNTIIFGTPSMTSTAPSTSKSIFGTPYTTSNVPSTNTSIFGTPSSVSNAPSMSPSIFGPSYTTSNVPSMNTCIFGTPSTVSNAPSMSPSIFGPSYTTSNVPSTNTCIFGTPSTVSNAPSMSPSIFGPSYTTSNVPSTNTSIFGTPSTVSNAPSTSLSIFGPPYTTSNAPSTNTSILGTPGTAFNAPSTNTSISSSPSLNNTSNSNITFGAATARNNSVPNTGPVLFGLTNNSIKVSNSEASLFGTSSTGAIFEVPNNNCVTSPSASIFGAPSTLINTSCGSNNAHLLSFANSTITSTSSGTSQTPSVSRITTEIGTSSINGNQLGAFNPNVNQRATTDGIDGNSSSCPYPYIPNSNGNRQTNSRSGFGVTTGNRGAPSNANSMANNIGNSIANSNNNRVPTTSVNSMANASSNSVASTSDNIIAAPIDNSMANLATASGTIASVVTPTTSNTLGVAPTLSNTFGVASTFSNTFGVASTSNNTFGVASTSSNTFGVAITTGNATYASTLSNVASSSTQARETYQNIPPNLISRLNDILKTGLSGTSINTLQREYSIPEDIALLKSPSLNPEIENNDQLKDDIKTFDKKLRNQQDLLGNGVVAIIKAMDLLLKEENIPLAIRALYNSTRLLSVVHFNITENRANFVLPLLEENVRNVLSESERDATVFGSDMSERVDVANMFKRNSDGDIREVENARVDNESDVNQPDVTRMFQLLESNISSLKTEILTKIDKLSEKVDEINDEREGDGESDSFAPSGSMENDQNSVSHHSDDSTENETEPLDDKFQTGNYVVQKSDIQWEGNRITNKPEGLHLYRVDANILLNKYKALYIGDLTAYKYKKTHEYTGWSKKRSADFISVTEAVVGGVSTLADVTCVPVDFTRLLDVLYRERTTESRVG